jgi:hypothetical protein
LKGEKVQTRTMPERWRDERSSHVIKFRHRIIRRYNSLKKQQLFGKYTYPSD